MFILGGRIPRPYTKGGRVIDALKSPARSSVVLWQISAVLVEKVRSMKGFAFRAAAAKGFGIAL